MEKSLPRKRKTFRFLQQLQTVTLLELVNASTAVNQLLTAGVIGMALAANFNRELLLGGAGDEGLAAGATDNRFTVLRMDLVLHESSLLQKTTTLAIITILQRKCKDFLSKFRQLFPVAVLCGGHIAILLINAHPVLQSLEEFSIICGLIHHADKLFGHLGRIASRQHPPDQAHPF